MHTEGRARLRQHRPSYTHTHTLPHEAGDTPRWQFSGAFSLLLKSGILRPILHKSTSPNTTDHLRITLPELLSSPQQGQSPHVIRAVLGSLWSPSSSHVRLWPCFHTTKGYTTNCLRPQNTAPSKTDSVATPGLQNSCAYVYFLATELSGICHM